MPQTFSRQSDQVGIQFPVCGQRGDDSLVGDVMPDDGDVVDHSDQALRVR